MNPNNFPRLNCSVGQTPRESRAILVPLISASFASVNDKDLLIDEDIDLTPHMMGNPSAFINGLQYLLINLQLVFTDGKPGNNFDYVLVSLFFDNGTQSHQTCYDFTSHIVPI